MMYEEEQQPKKRRPKLSAIDRALKHLGVRAHGVAELTAKLRRGGYPEEEVTHAIELCRQHRYLDDRAFAVAAAHEIGECGGGKRLIQMKLRRKGIASEDVAAALEEQGENELDNAIRSAQYKLRCLEREKDPRKKREKIVRFLAGRGFSFEMISRALDAIRREDSEKE